MKTVQMSLDDDIIRAIDETAKNMGMTPASFIRHSLRLVLRHYDMKASEEKHIKGYMQNPVRPGEFDGWENEQVWTDE